MLGECLIAMAVKVNNISIIREKEKQNKTAVLQPDNQKDYFCVSPVLAKYLACELHN